MNAPAAVSVVSGETIRSAPTPTWPELLRNVPGVNSVRMTNRDANVTSRQGTSTLANSELVLVDGRSVYLDFIGAILWDLIPTDPSDVAQIEVVRGPASVVWGANALTGVVNILTRSPRSAPDASALLSATSFDRDTGSTAGGGSGLAYGASVSLARTLGDRFSYRVSGGYSASDPFPRPVGELPVVPHPLSPDDLVGGGRLPDDVAGEPGDYRNRGTVQPRLDVRVDQELGRGRLSYSAGIAGTEGIIHTGIGPFNLERNSTFAYGRVAFSRDQLRVASFVNYFGSRATNQLLFQRDEEGEEQPVRLNSYTRTYDLEAADSWVLGRHIVTVGGNLRHEGFDVSLAPSAEDRTEGGAYAQEEFFLDKWRFAVGARLDKLGNLDHVLFSPRLSVLWKPSPHHALRISANRAFRAPTVINDYLDVVYLRPVDLAALLPDLPPELGPAVEEDFLLSQRALGNPNLKEESLTAYELGYIGSFGDTSLGGSLYVYDTRDNINFASPLDPANRYTAADPPPDWPLPPSVLDDLAVRENYFLRTSNQFRNLGPIRRKGLELFVEHRFGDGVTGYLNYSWQGDPRPLPDPTPFPALEITVPPRNRVNAGVTWSGPRLLGSLAFSHADRAFWVDVLPHDYDGYSDSYVVFDASFGVRWAGGRIVTTLRGTNLTNVDVQPHDYGDIQKRAVALQVRLHF